MANTNAQSKTVVVTGGAQGIGAAVVDAFLERGYNVVATSLRFADSGRAESAKLAWVAGDIGSAATAEKVTQTAREKFGSLDHVVHCAGIYLSKPFTETSLEEFRKLVSVNLEGFILLTQCAVKQMLAQGTGGSVTSITAALADNPIAASPAALAMITKGGLDAGILSLASEYAKRNIRFNAVAPGVVDTPLHRATPREVLQKLTPMGVVAEARDIAEAVVYLTEARYVTGEVLHVDGGAHAGQW